MIDDKFVDEASPGALHNNISLLLTKCHDNHTDTLIIAVSSCASLKMP